MTVEEVIDKLKQMPKDKRVFYWDEEREEFTIINKVFLDKDGDVSLSI